MRIIISPNQKSEHKAEAGVGNPQVRNEMRGISACGGARHVFRKTFTFKINASIFALHQSYI